MDPGNLPSIPGHAWPCSNSVGDALGDAAAPLPGSSTSSTAYDGHAMHSAVYDPHRLPTLGRAADGSTLGLVGALPQARLAKAMLLCAAAHHPVGVNRDGITGEVRVLKGIPAVSHHIAREVVEAELPDLAGEGAGRVELDGMVHSTL
eukprot:7378613-Prymnesium_polylepis.1